MSGHTPGPWTLSSEPDGTFLVDSETLAAGPVAQLSPDCENISEESRIANARIIAAAPELLSQLHNAYHELNAIHARDGVPRTHEGFKSSVSQEYFTGLVEGIRDLLARIDGDSDVR